MARREAGARSRRPPRRLLNFLPLWFAPKRLALAPGPIMSMLGRMARILITGANRGLGLELTRQSLAAGDTVLATARKPGEATELRKLAAEAGDRLQVFELAVDSPASIGRAAQLAGQLVDGLDLLVNNAGIAVWEDLMALDPVGMERSFRTNTIGPVLVTRALLPLLRKGDRALVVNITSELGSVGGTRTGGNSGSYAYNASKAALNMVSAILAHDLRADGITVIAQHPGWVRTDMGGAAAPLLPKESVAAQLALWRRITPADSGRYLDIEGGDLAD